MEVTAATIALGIITVGVLQATIALDHARQATERMDYASRELDNLMERFVHRPWSAITQDTAARMEPPPEVARQLPAVQLETLVMAEVEPVDAKRITMKLRWRAQAGEMGEPLVLTTWVFPPQEATP